MLFCDTSTLAKYYVPEPESGAVCARLDAEDQRWRPLRPRCFLFVREAEQHGQ